MITQCSAFLVTLVICEYGLIHRTLCHNDGIMRVKFQLIAHTRAHTCIILFDYIIRIDHVVACDHGYGIHGYCSTPLRLVVLCL